MLKMMGKVWHCGQRLGEIKKHGTSSGRNASHGEASRGQRWHVYHKVEKRGNIEAHDEDQVEKEG